MTVMEVLVLAVVMMEVVTPNNSGGCLTGKGRQVQPLNYIVFIQLIAKQDINDLHFIAFINLGLATAS